MSNWNDRTVVNWNVKYYDSSSFEEAGVTGVRIEFHLDKLSFKYLLSISYVRQLNTESGVQLKN